MPDPTVVVDFHQEANGDWRWRARSAGNHETLAVSSEGYRRRIDAETSARQVMPDADFTEVTEPHTDE